MLRRTISIPEYLDDHIASVAEERGTSYSAAAVRLLEQAADLPLPYAGVGEGPGDLSIRTEEYLDQNCGRVAG